MSATTFLPPVHPAGPPLVFLKSLLILRISATFQYIACAAFPAFPAFFKWKLSGNSDDEWAQARCAFEQAFPLFLLFHKCELSGISVK
jgi:hypothetical protein